MNLVEKHILILDDEPGITLLCERLLRRAGASVVGFTTAREALDHLRGHRMDLLIVDIRMPDMDGFSVISLAQQIQPDLAILIMTGFGTIETAIRALRQGVDGLLLKPFAEGSELLQAVHLALEDHQKKRDASLMPMLRALFQVIEVLFSETDPHRLGTLIVQVIRSHLNASQAALLKQEGEELSPIAGQVAPQGRAFLWKALQGEEPLLIGMHTMNEEAQEFLQRNSISSAMLVPLARHGAAHLYYAGKADGSFREVDLELFSLLARQASVALENARLYAELRSYVRRVEESQQALIQAEKMATVGRLTASIAHEINNPLQALQNCLHLAGHPELPLEERLHYFELARHELERLRTIVGQMLNFYRPAVQNEVFALPEVWENVLKLMKNSLEQHRIRVETSWPKEISSIRGSKAQIQQVFLNLLLNSVQAMPEGGEIRLWAEQRNQTIEIYVQDSGPGIPPDLRAHIFEPFFSTKEGGTGLGLTVSYNILTSHGGRLELVADRPGGACFRISLPIVSPLQSLEGKYETQLAYRG
nr:multi-sensor signal transduction histidine kinase [uncultured Chloroflexota bacterium]